MNSEHDEFENFLLEYCETTVVPADAVSVPLTIRNYERTIQANKGNSIFYDDESSVPWTSDQNDINGTNVPVGDHQAYQDAMLFEEPVIRVTYGRGRGRQNISHRPGYSSKSVSDDDLQIQKYIRMVAPIGYRNEVTENAVLTIHRAKKEQTKLEKKSRESTPKGSNTSSPSSCSKSEFTGHFSKFAMTSSGKSSDTNNIGSSDCLSTSEDKNSSLDSFDENETHPEESKMTSTQPEANDFVGPPVPETTIKSSKSVPSISALLRMTMEQRKRDLQIAKAKREAQQEKESIETIEKLLKEDMEQEEMRKNRIHKSRSTSSSQIDYPRSEKEVLNWGQGSNSPRFAWHQNTMQKRQKVFLNNLDDFPPLK